MNVISTKKYKTISTKKNKTNDKSQIPAQDIYNPTIISSKSGRKKNQKQGSSILEHNVKSSSMEK